MKKLFMLIDADEFLQATQGAGDLDNGLTAAFIRGFNFCAAGGAESLSVNRERTEYRPPALVSSKDVYDAVNAAQALTNAPEFDGAHYNVKIHYENIATQLNKRLQSA